MHKTVEIKAGMIIDDGREKFEQISAELMGWLRHYGHPHMTVLATQTAVELTEGIKVVPYEVEEEPYDCPIHGLQDGPECPRC